MQIVPPTSLEATVATQMGKERQLGLPVGKTKSRHCHLSFQSAFAADF